MKDNIQSYKDLIVWQKSIDLVSEVYKVTGYFPREELYGLSSQMRRASFQFHRILLKEEGVAQEKILDIFCK